jgi:hypothetical protein
MSHEIAAHLSGARNDTPFLSLRGTIVPKQTRWGWWAHGLPRFTFAMLRALAHRNDRSEAKQREKDSTAPVRLWAL